MSDLTVAELKEKIENIKQDIATNTDLKTRSVLSDYLDYLKDEIRMLEDAERSGKSTD
jgi:hypothetical protein